MGMLIRISFSFSSFLEPTVHHFTSKLAVPLAVPYCFKKWLTCCESSYMKDGGRNNSYNVEQRQIKCKWFSVLLGTSKNLFTFWLGSWKTSQNVTFSSYMGSNSSPFDLLRRMYSHNFLFAFLHTPSFPLSQYISFRMHFLIFHYYQ